MTNDETTTTLHGLIEDLIDSLNIDKEDILNSNYPEDLLHEYVDGQVPIYYSDLLEVAAQDIDMALLVPELGPAFGGEATPVNIIAANIYEALQAAAWEWLEENKEDEDEATNEN